MCPGFCFRSLSTKETSVHSSTTPSPSSGRCWTAPDTRRWCLLSASSYLQSTRRPWTAWRGENQWETEWNGTLGNVCLKPDHFYGVISKTCALLSYPSLDGGHQTMVTMWQTLHINMKSLLSWQYLMKDFTQIHSWNITMVSTNTYLQIKVKI